VTGSAPFGESIDPETLRGLLAATSNAWRGSSRGRRQRGAAEAPDQALARYEGKGNLVMTERTRDQLQTLRIS
jgi:hypothetical protein